MIRTIKIITVGLLAGLSAISMAQAASSIYASGQGLQSMDIDPATGIIISGSDMTLPNKKFSAITKNQDETTLIAASLNEVYAFLLDPGSGKISAQTSPSVAQNGQEKTSLIKQIVSYNKFIYSVNRNLAGTNYTISKYVLDKNNNITLISKDVAATSQVNLYKVSGITCDPNVNSCYVANDNQILVYGVNSQDGSWMYIKTIDTPATATHIALTVGLTTDHKGHLYAPASYGKIYIFSINQLGDINYQNEIDSSTLPYNQLVVAPGGKYAYLPFLSSNGNIALTEYRIDQETGNLLFLKNTDLRIPAPSLSSSLSGLLFDNTGVFLYVANASLNTIYSFVKSDDSGEIIENPWQTTFQSSNNPSGITF